MHRCHKGQVWQPILGGAQRMMSTTPSMLRLNTGHSPAKPEHREATVYAMSTVWMRLLLHTRLRKSANYCALQLLCPYASGMFLCCHQLLFSTMHCCDITIRIAHGLSSSKTLHSMAYGFLYIHTVYCIPNVTYTIPYKASKEEGLAQQTVSKLT